jgi:hypothetical protein
MVDESETVHLAARSAHEGSKPPIVIEPQGMKPGVRSQIVDVPVRSCGQLLMVGDPGTQGVKAEALQSAEKADHRVDLEWMGIRYEGDLNKR